MSTYTVRVAAEVADYVAEIAKLPGVTQKQAARAGLRLQAEFAKAANAAAKEAEKASKGVGDGLMSRFTFSPSDVKGALTALADLASSAAATQHEMESLAARTGLSVEAVAGVKLAAEAAGTSLDAVGDGLENLPDAIRQAAAGTGEQAEAFKALGISATNTDGTLRDTTEVFRDLLTAVGKLPTPIEKAAAMTGLLGDSGARVLAAGLGEGVEVLDAFTEAAARSGLTSEAAAHAADEWSAASATLKNAIQGTGAQIFSSLGPIAAGWLKDFSLGLVAIRELGAAALVDGAKAMTEALGVFYDVLSGKRTIEEARAELRRLTAAFTDGIVQAAHNTKAFYQQMKATEAVGEAARSAEGPVSRLQVANSAAADAAKEAEKAAKEEAQALKELEEALADVAAANAEHADPIAATFSRANEELDALLMNLAAANRLTDEAAAILQAGYERAAEVRAEALAAEVQEYEAARKQVADMEQAAHDAVLQHIEEERQARLAGVQSVLSAAGTLTSAIADYAEQQAEQAGATEAELFALRKRASLASAIVSTAQAVTTALASAPPPANALLALAAGAAGAIQIATIKSQSFNDTPGAQHIRKPGGGAVHFAAGDYFVAARDPQELLRQSADLVSGKKGPKSATPRASSSRPPPAPSSAPAQITVAFQLGGRTLQEQTVRTANAPGPARRIMRSGRPWRSV